MITQFINWIRWCVKFKEIMSWDVGLVSFGELTEDEYDYPEVMKFILG